MALDEEQPDLPIGYAVSGVLEWISLVVAIESLGLAARDFIHTPLQTSPQGAE